MIVNIMNYLEVVMVFCLLTLLFEQCYLYSGGFLGL